MRYSICRFCKRRTLYPQAHPEANAENKESKITNPDCWREQEWLQANQKGAAPADYQLIFPLITIG